MIKPVALAAVVALTIALAVAYEKKWLNKLLPAKWQKEGFNAADAITAHLGGQVNADNRHLASQIPSCSPPSHPVHLMGRGWVCMTPVDYT
jgi:hypothetical protein